MLKKITKLFKNPKLILFKLSQHKIINISDEKYISLHYYSCFGNYPNLSNPQTFNEKIQYIKLHKTSKKYCRMVDKITAKEFVNERLGTDENIIKTYGIYDKFADIDFSILPNKFVIKCNHDSGGLVVVKDKSKLDINKARRKISKALKRNWYSVSREAIYKEIKPKILIEEFLEETKAAELVDYKFFCFNGTPKFLSVSMGMSDHSTAQVTYFDMNFVKEPFKRKDYPEIGFKLNKPKNYDQMIEIAKKLSTGYDFVRVDLYNIEGKIYFGEMTFTPSAGFIPFDPIEYDLKIGQMLKLDKKVIK